jgi:hypothetical protein
VKGRLQAGEESLRLFYFEIFNLFEKNILAGYPTDSLLYKKKRADLYKEIALIA